MINIVHVDFIMLYYFCLYRASIISVGIGAFVLARTSVTKNRYKVMKTKERIRDQTRAEQEQNRIS